MSSSSSKKRLRSSPSDKASSLRSVGKRNCIKVLQKALSTKTSKVDFFRQLISDTQDLLESSAPNDFLTDDDYVNWTSQTNRKYIVHKKALKDQHQKQCKVCAQGGSLLCCDLCSYVFHMECLQPTLTTLPPRRWVCPFCELKTNATDSLHNSLYAMLLNSQFFDANDNQTYITRAANRFILKRPNTAQQKQHSLKSSSSSHDDCKYYSLETALYASTQMSNEQKTVQSKEAAASTDLKNKTAKGKDKDDNNADGSAGRNGGDDEVWCTYCLDDPSVPLCGFCGCRNCFGKQDSSRVILCDGCNGEFHIECLDPPLSQLPSGTWYCSDKCSEDAGEVPSPLEKKLDDRAFKAEKVVVPVKEEDICEVAVVSHTQAMGESVLSEIAEQQVQVEVVPAPVSTHTGKPRGRPRKIHTLPNARIDAEVTKLVAAVKEPMIGAVEVAAVIASIRSLDGSAILSSSDAIRLSEFRLLAPLNEVEDVLAALEQKKQDLLRKKNVQIPHDSEVSMTEG